MIHFIVHGLAEPAGSKRAFTNPKTGRTIVTDANAKAGPWKREVTEAAVEAMNGNLLLDGPLVLTLAFYVPRPKGHFGKKGLRPSAPAYPAVKPDLTKLVRGVEDALTGIVYRDDAQIVVQRFQKLYGEPARVIVYIDRA
jgi:Holliday junction resolvase RusA-like endonuclease